MKAYTDISQSKRLKEILPLESADMAWYPSFAKEGYSIRMLNDTYPLDIIGEEYDEIPCWSLAALVDIMPNGCLIKNINGKYKVLSNSSCVINDVFNNSVDACVEMIMRLNEQKLL